MATTSPPPATTTTPPATVPATADPGVFSSGLRILLGTAALVVIIAGLRAAAALVVPFLMAVFVAILSALPLAWLRQRGVPRWLTLPLALTALVVVTVVLSGLIAGAVNRFVREWPTTYEPRAQHLAEQWNARLEAQVDKHTWLAEMRVDDLRSLWSDWANPDALMQHFIGALRTTGGMLSQALMILITAILLLAEGAALPQKLQMISPGAAHRTQDLGRIVTEIHRYLAIKTWTSLMTGVPIAVGLWLLGIDFPLLWGLLAFLLNFVPNIGSVLAAIPALVLAILQTEGDFKLPVAAAVLYMVVNAVMGYLVEPRWMGRGLGLSTLVVFVSLVFWGWVLGPIGMLISVPLTMAVKIMLESNADTRWIAILMGTDEQSARA